MTTIAASIERRGDREVVAVQNVGTALAFQVHLRLIDPKTDNEVPAGVLG